MYKWFLALRYLHTKLIALFGVASVMLCVAMVLVVLSVMGGFLDTVRERARGLHSEVVLDGQTLTGFPYYEEFEAHLAKTLPDVVEATTPVLLSYGIFRVPKSSWTKPAQILGVRLDDYIKVNDFKAGLHYERYYPGTTSLDPQQMPVAGVTEESREPVLPADLEEANRKWRESETDEKAIAAYLASPFHPSSYPDTIPWTPGERIYAVDLGAPRYAGREHSGIIVGCDLINERRADGNFDRFYARGADVALMLLPLSPSGNPLGEPPIRIPLRYVDDSRTGIYEIDSQCVYVNFDMLQEKLAMTPQELIDGGMTPARTNQLFIGLHDGVDINAAKDRIQAEWESYQQAVAADVHPADAAAMRRTKAFTWEDLQRPFIAAVEKEKVLVTFLFSLISMVAIVLLGCIFYMIVEKKTRDIGILKALGASRSGVAGLFVAYAGAIGLIGALLGTALGAEVVWHVNDIQDWLANLNPELRIWSPDIYSFDKIPSVVKTADAVAIGAFAVLSSIIGSLIPAWIASRVWPVAALRYE